MLNGIAEITSRERRGENCFKFGISFLDDALRGIFPADNIVMAARSGGGKTQWCCEVMDSALNQGKRVLFIALEAEKFEIESRLKWKIFMRKFLEQRGSHEFVDPVEWMLGRYVNKYVDIEQAANDEFEKQYSNAIIHYKGTGEFTVQSLIDVTMRYADEVDLIIIDHLHYFDFDPAEQENRAIKTIIMQARDLDLSENKPMILVSHVRKTDKRYPTLAPDMEELHGSSEIFKVATKLITIGTGQTIREGSYETFMRCSKFRWDGGVSRFVAQMYYSPKGGGYESDYKLGWASAQTFEDIGEPNYPNWARRTRTPSVRHDPRLKRFTPYSEDD